MKKITTRTIQNLKDNNEKIVALTAYDYSTAKYIDEVGVEMILVGDSLANVILGYSSTHSVTMNEMLIFVSAVARGVTNALVVGDMPFMSYTVSFEEAIKNAGEMIRSGANAVKLEGCNDYILNLIKRCKIAGIPVLGHIGYTPQSVDILGGHSIQGKTSEEAIELLDKAKMLQTAGAFAIVLEMIPEETAKYITENINIPTIGIGAGRYCSGHILVSDDMFGKFSDYKPKFVRHYADMKQVIIDATKNYYNDIKSGDYPSENECFKLNKEQILSY